MISKKVRVINRQGFHMRPARAFARAASSYESSVTIMFNGTKINAKSLMNIISACIMYGSEIEIVCDGADENEALAETTGLVESGFTGRRL